MPQTAPPTIAALPDAPQTSDGRLVFPGKADAFVAALATFRTQANALGSNVYANAGDAYAQAVAAAQQASASAASATLSQSQVALASAQATTAAASAASALAAPATTATSATSMTPGTGTRSFTTQSGKAFVAGQGLTITSAADPRQWMVGTVSSYSGTALSVNVTAFGQAPTGGAAADWVIAFWGAVPAAAKQGQVLRLRGAVPEWGDVGGEPVVIASALNRQPQSAGAAIGAGDITVTPNSAIGPRGGLTASTLTAGASTAFVATVHAGYTAGQRVTYERSLRAVSGSTLCRLNIYFYGDASDSWVIVDLASGQIVEVGSNNAALRVLPAARVVSQGGGWYRVTMQVVVHVAGDIVVYVIPYASSSYHEADASVTDAMQPALYVDVPSTSAVAGAGPRRRNRIGHSLSADSVTGFYGVTGGASRVGRVLSPMGDLTATAYLLSSSASSCVVSAFLGVAGEQYTISVWVRVVAGTPTPSGKIRVLPSTDIAVPVSTVWRRVTATFVAASTGSISVLLPFDAGAGVTLAYWQCQVERGPVASNPILTAGAEADGQHADLQPRRVHHVDTTHAAVIVAPPLMEPGDWFDVVDIGGNAAINNITVLRGPYSAIAGDATDFEIDVPRWSGRFVFDPEKGLVIQ